MNKLVHKAAVLLAMMCVVAVLPLFAAGSSDKNASENVLDVYSIMPEKYATPILAEFTKDTGIKVNFVPFLQAKRCRVLLRKKTIRKLTVCGAVRRILTTRVLPKAYLNSIRPLKRIKFL